MVSSPGPAGPFPEFGIEGEGRMSGAQTMLDLRAEAEALQAIVLKVIAAALGQDVSDIRLGMSLDDLGVDSHALAEVVLELEDQLGFEFEPEDVDVFAESTSVTALVSAIAAARVARSGK
jgi:acyl carrier protein